MSSVIMQFPKPHLRCSAAATTGGLPERRSSPIERRSGGYKPTLWDFDSIQSLNTNYNEEMHQKRATALINQVKTVLIHEEEVDHVRSLELIDDLQRLGISCHFDDEISQILNSSHFNQKYGRDLYSTALGFRLLRQHGFNVSQEVFDCFKNEKGGDFKASLYDDTNGLLQLYEASFLSTQGEDTLELARNFATKFLHKKLDHHQIDDNNLLSSVRDALKFPLHWKVQKWNARLFIDAYKRRPGMNSNVLELAQLDTNIVQAQFQQELKEASRWWNNTCLAQRLPFVRDRIVECYYWTTGSLVRRQHGYERIMLTKVIALIVVIDDIFDVYGTLEELQLFLTAVQRWDTESMKQLPHYMQLCYLALYNFVNESAYDTLKERGFNPIPYLHNAWVALVESYMREAEWYHKGHKPSMEEYINNAWKSVGSLPIMSHLFFPLTDSLERKNIVESMYKYDDMVRAAATIARLVDDLGTSLDEVERGDVPKSIQCYMKEKGGSEEEARQQLRREIEQSWKTINKEMIMMKSSSSSSSSSSADSPFSKYYVEALANLARTAQFIYQEDSDGFGMQHSKVNKLVRGLLFDPYPYTY